MKGKIPRLRRIPWHLFVFIGPGFLIYSLFMIFPLVDSIRLSFYAPNPETRIEEFVALQNYQRLLTDPNYSERLGSALRNNFGFFVVHMLVQNPIGLLIAVLLSSPFIGGRAIYRTLIFLPTVLSFVLVGFIWQMMLNPLRWGIVRSLLTSIGLRDWFAPWLGLEDTALIAISLISVWQFVGIPMMLFLAALVSIPDELVEAARVDGATAWTVFWHIKFPLLLPTVGIVGVLTFVGNFNAFDLVYTMQGGLAGPSFATDLMGTFFHRTFFGFQLQPGLPTMGATIAGVMLIIILTGILIYLFGYQRRITQVEF